MRIVFANLFSLNPQVAGALQKLAATEADIVIVAELRAKHVAQARAIFRDYREQVILGANPVGHLAVFSHYRTGTLAEMANGVFANRPAGMLAFVEPRPFALFAVHLSAPWTPRRHRRRDEQLSALCEDVKRQIGPSIVAGDFNASHRSPGLKALNHNAGLADARDGRHHLPTWPPLGSFWCIDHIFYSQRHFNLTDFRVLPPMWSDHLPIIADLVFV